MTGAQPAPSMHSMPLLRRISTSQQTPAGPAVHPYGSGAARSPSGPRSDGERFFTPPNTPRGGPTRRDREERQADRDASRWPHINEDKRIAQEGLEARIQDWITRLLACEQTCRNVSREYIAHERTFT